MARERATLDPQHLRRLIELCRDAVVIIDAEARITMLNPSAEQMFGWRLEEVLGAKVELLMPEPYASEHAGYVERYQRTGEAHAIGRIREVRAKRRDGETFPIELSVTELADDPVARYAAFIRDASEKTRRERERVEQERLSSIGIATSVLVHEVANPLNNMFLHAQMLARDLRKEGSALAERADTITSEIRRLTAMLDGFRKLRRRRPLEAEAVDLARLTDEVVTAFLRPLASSRVEILSTVEEGVPLVVAQRDELLQLLIHLGTNAIEAMPEGGTLSILTRSVGDSVEIALEDTGGGIPPGMDVFQPFVTTKKDGTGLGLPIARQIVHAHEGAITYTSEPGRGTRFVVVLPVEPTRLSAPLAR